MKTFIKLTVLAAIAVFAVFSCTPEAELSEIDWSAINSRDDVTQNTSVVHVKPSLSVSNLATGTPTLESNQVTLTFDTKADFLKSSEATIEARLKTFLSFHHFTVAEIPNVGDADTLEAALNYSYVKRLDNVVTIKLNKTFVGTDSPVIAKINGATYTFANGNRMDNVIRGITGGAGYDDVYITIPVTGAGTTPFMAPGNKGWNLELLSIGGTPGPGLTTTGNVVIATLNITGDRIDNGIKAAVANRLQSGLRVERFVNKSWVNAGVTSSISYDDPNNRFMVTSLTRGDLVPHRVVWSGNAPVTTSTDYFGVKQWVKVIGTNTGSTQHDYYMGTVYGPVATPWYSIGTGADTDYRFLPKADPSFAPSVSLFSCDPNGKNVVIEVTFKKIVYGTPTATTYGLRTLSTQVFKDNFKIAYYKGSGGTANDFTIRTDVAYIGIKDYTYLDSAPTNPQSGPNKIRITLDPAYQMDSRPKYLYLSPEICYEDNLKSGFGSADNWQYGFFRVYAGDFGEDVIPPSFSLTVNEWANGNFTGGISENWYLFPVTTGTQYNIWWNDSYEGDGTKSIDVRVSARYSGTSSWIFSNIDSGWTTPQTFTATQNGTVEIRVSPYSASYTSGTYGIAYSISRPAP